MFNFRKKKDKSQDAANIDEPQIDADVFDMNMLFESLEYTNSYLAQISMNLGELARQQTIANALHILDSEYNNADSLMDVEEILQKKYALFGSIFVDYQVKQEEEDKND